MPRKNILTAIIFLVVFGLGLFAFSTQAQAATECSDGLDNDGDGLIDYPADPQCASVNDDHESDSPTTFFRQHSAWTQSLPANPSVHSNSTAMISDLWASSNNGFIIAAGTRGYGGFAYWEVSGVEGVDWDYVTIDVGENTIGHLTALQATHTIDGGPPHSHSTGMQRDAITEHGWNVNVPMPVGAVPPGNNTICADGYAYHDSPMVVVGPDGEALWDMYNLSHCAGSNRSGGQADRMTPESGYWKAKVVRKWSKNSDGLSLESKSGYPYGFYDLHGSTGSAYNSYIPGVLTVDEIKNQDSINHALRMLGGGWKCGVGYIQHYTLPYPATAAVGAQCVGTEEITTIPYGQLFQLPSNYDCSQYSDANYSPTTNYNFYQKICVAMKKYGVYYVDSSEHVPWLILPLENVYWDDSKSWAGVAVLDGSKKLDRNIVSNLQALNQPFPDTWENTAQCADGIDNDGDGLIDYPADPGCVSAYGDNSESGVSANPADINSDGKVNIKDIQICIKAITAPGSFNPDRLEQLQKCKKLAQPNITANIKDIQVIIREIIR